MDTYLEWVGILLFVFMLPVLWRIVNGPRVIDRIVAANVIGTKTMLILLIIGTLFHRVELFVDFAITYALLNFIASLAAARHLLKMGPRDGVESSQEGSQPG